MASGDGEPAPPGAPLISVEVAYGAGPRQMDLSTVRLPSGSSVAEAVQASGVLSRHKGLRLAGVALGIWGRSVLAEQLLNDGDRVELYRPLQVDPKESRRLRYRAQGERGRRKPGHR